MTEQNIQTSDLPVSEAISLSRDQEAAFNAFKDFIASTDRIFILTGSAGTGKTTLIRQFCEWMKEEKVTFKLSATTGRAARVLSAKVKHEAQTLHSLIYVFDEVTGQTEDKKELTPASQQGQLTLQFEVRALLPGYDGADLIVVDEASMISHITATEGFIAKFGSGNIINDLLKCCPGSKILFVGDSCQLPPVAEVSFSAALSESYWQSVGLSVRSHHLTEVFRQGQESEILQVAQRFRQRIEQPTGQYMKLPVPQGKNIFSTLGKEQFMQRYFEAVQEHGLQECVCVCHSNEIVLKMNNIIRGKLKRPKQLSVGDVLCVVQNSYGTDLVNGDQVEVMSVGEKSSLAGFSFIDAEVQGFFDKNIYTVKIIEDLLYSAKSALSQEEAQRLLIDFDWRMRKLSISRNSETYKTEMRSDPYLNALRAKFGYALTVHKAQGGEWKQVFLYLHQSIYSMTYARKGGQHSDAENRFHRWFYTGVTRAIEKLHYNDSDFVENFRIREPAAYIQYWKQVQRASKAKTTGGTTKQTRKKQVPSETFTGTISIILNQNERGANGFIKRDESQSSADNTIPRKVYFTVYSDSKDITKTVTGARVRFEVVKDKKQEQFRAVRLTFID